MESRLQWNGSIKAQKAADAAYAKLKSKPKPEPKLKAKRKHKKNRRQKRRPLRLPPVKRGAKWYHRVYLLSKWWRVRREQALNAASWTCSECGKRNGLEVHHLRYGNLYRESDEDLVVLCRDCHQKRHPESGPAVLHIVIGAT